MPLGDAFTAFMQERQQRYMLNKQAIQQRMLNDRTQQQEMLRMMLFNNSPALAREARLKSQFATRQKDAQNQDQAWLRALMLADPNSIAPELRGRLKAYQQYYNANPTGSGKIIQQFLSQGKPHPIQLKSTVTTDADGNLVTNYETWNPNEGTVPKAAAGVPTSMAPVAAGGESDGLSDDAKALLKEHGF